MSDNQSNPEELLSAVFDEESTESVDLSDERRKELEYVWGGLRRDLQALPRSSVDLVAAVGEQLADSARPQTPAGVRQSWVSTMAVVATLAAVVLLLILPRATVDRTDSYRRSAAMLRKHVDRLVPDLNDCHVVVINVGAEVSVEETVREMLGAAEAQGAAITAMHAEIDEGAEYSAGFLLTSGSEPHAILDSVSEDPEQLLWNPASIGGRSHEEIKEMFLASMRVPTESDKVFGAMYVVNEDSLVVSLEQLPADAAEPSTAVAVADGPAADIDPDSHAADADDEMAAKVISPTPVAAAPAASALVRSADQSEAAPLIVIFRRQSPPSAEETLPGQGDSRSGRTTPPSV